MPGILMSVSTTSNSDVPASAAATASIAALPSKQSVTSSPINPRLIPRAIHASSSTIRILMVGVCDRRIRARNIGAARAQNAKSLRVREAAAADSALPDEDLNESRIEPNHVYVTPDRGDLDEWVRDDIRDDREVDHANLERLASATRKRRRRTGVESTFVLLDQATGASRRSPDSITTLRLPRLRGSFVNAS
ncbi:MAG: hypothetical protein AB7T06_09770 [Kofleriaceae bacterium]